MTDLMKFTRPNDSWADVFAATEKIYAGPSAIVAKPTRFGFTTSFAKIAERNNDRLLIITPTNKLFKTIENAADSAIQIYGHGYCKIRAEREDQFLNKFWTSLPPACPADGTSCAEFPDCKLKIAWFESAPVRVMTYAKLIPVAFLYSAENELIRDQLKDVSHVMFDESHIPSLDNLPSADLNHSIKNIPIEFDYLRKVYFDFCDLINELREDDIIKQLDLTRNHLKSESFLSFNYENTKMIDRTLQTHAFSDVKRLAENRESLDFNEEDILYLADVINVMTCDRVTANLITSSAGDKYLITGKPTANSPTIKNALRLFLKEVCPNAKVFFVSGSQFEKYPGFFEEIAGHPLANACVPDIKNTNVKMTIIPDTWEYSTIVVNGVDLSGKSDERIKNHILDILIENPGEPIYIICFNKKLQAKIKKWKLLLPPGSLIDYYRSPDSIGVECSARIGIAIGIANNPSNTYDYATENLAESRSLRLQDVHSATWQAWSRIKDPEGKVPSTLYCIGVRSDDVSAVIRQGSNRTVIYNGKDKNNRNIPATITVSEELPRPKIMMEKKTKIALEPRKCSVDDYIDCVVPLEDRIKDEVVDMRLYKVYKESKKTQLFYIYNLICKKIELSYFSDYKLYNPNESPDWIENNSLLFYTNIISRIDRCAFQDKVPKKNNKWGYTNKTLSSSFNTYLIQHFNAQETIALPPFDTNDMCYWCAADFDDHLGITPQTDNVRKFNQFIMSKNVPFFTLMSGTNLGYHVWILLEPCKTYTAYKFLEQLIHDSGVESKNIDLFPAQKSSSGTKMTKGFGSALKLPNAFNWKAGRRSVLVDPITLKHTPYVTIPGVLRLHEINEVPVKHRTKKQKTYIPVNNIVVKDGRSFGNMRPCLLEALDQQLIGGSGHQARVAIATEAVKAGLDYDSIIKLFESQDDFDPAISAAQVDSVIDNEYNAWNCETIHDKCGDYIKCENCPHYIPENIKIENETDNDNEIEQET